MSERDEWAPPSKATLLEKVLIAMLIVASIYALWDLFA
jgi:hypothetical protein